MKFYSTQLWITFDFVDNLWITLLLPITPSWTLAAILTYTSHRHLDCFLESMPIRTQDSLPPKAVGQETAQFLKLLGFRKGFLDAAGLSPNSLVYKNEV